MSWYCNSIRVCKNCGYEYIEDDSTLSMARGNYGKCPKCQGETKIIVRKSSNNTFIEKLKRVYK